MKLNKIILSLLLVCSFSYGATIKDIINNSEKEKKDNLEKLKRIKNPDSLLNEFDFDYKKYLNNEISITRLLAIRLANRSVHISEYLNSVSRITWTLFVRIFSEF